MPKRSRKTAARYSELSTLRKKRQLTRPGPAPEAVSTPQDQEAVTPAPKKTPVPSSPALRKGPSAQPGMKPSSPDYSYVRDDLKRVGTFTAAIVLVIIILAFILG